MGLPITDDRIRYNARQYGFPLFGNERVESVRMRPEDLVIEILRGLKEGVDPRYVQGIPVILAKNEVDYGYLVRRARIEGLTSAVGWVLDESREAFDRMAVPQVGDLRSAIDSLFSERSSQNVFLDKEDSETLEWALEGRTSIAEKWNICDVYSSDSFDKMLRIYRCTRDR